MTTQDQTIDWEAELTLHREWMVRIARFRLRDPHLCEDLIQDVSLGVIRSNPVLDDPGRIRSWLYQAVVRRVADYLRKQYRQMHAIDELTQRDQTTRPDESWQWMLASEQRTLLAAAIKKLSESDRAILLLKFTHNWSCKKIGKPLGIAERAVEYRLVRAKQQLRSESIHLGGNENE